MLYHELYGMYYHTVAAVLTEAVKGNLTGKKIGSIVQEKAFGESILTIPDRLRSGDWALLTSDLTTPLKHRPTQPLTLLQKQWMKALLSDPRMALFEPDLQGLEDIEPLFDMQTFVWYDRCRDGDPYEDPGYIACFRRTLQAIREKSGLRVRFRSAAGIERQAEGRPLRLEYSPRDDKFRLLLACRQRILTINLVRIVSCEAVAADPAPQVCEISYRECSVTFELVDSRNAMERILLHFSDLEKETVRLDDYRYRVTLYYRKEDETELLIRLLSFGAVLQVISPEPFIDLIRQRIAAQDRLLQASV